MNLRGFFGRFINTETPEVKQITLENVCKMQIDLSRIRKIDDALDCVFLALDKINLGTAENKFLVKNHGQYANYISMALDELRKTRAHSLWNIGKRDALLQKHFEALMSHLDDLPLIIMALKLLNDEDTRGEREALWWATPGNLMAVIFAIDRLKPLATIEANIKNVVAILLKLHVANLSTDENCTSIALNAEFSQNILNGLRDRAAPAPLTQAYFDQVLRGVVAVVRHTVKQAISSLSPILEEKEKKEIPGEYNTGALDMLVPKYCEMYLFSTPEQRIAEAKEAKALAEAEVALQEERAEANRNMTVC